MIYIGSEECDKISSGFISQQLNLYDWALQEDGTLLLSLANRATDDITITEIASEGGTDDIEDIEIPLSGGSKQIKTKQGTGRIGNPRNCYKDSILVIKYEVDDGTVHSLTGRINGYFESSIGGLSEELFYVDFRTTGSKTFILGESGVITFTFDGINEHTLKADDIASDHITMTIASDPQIFKTKSGGIITVDIDGDGNYDIKIEVGELSSGHAKITLIRIGLPTKENEEPPQPINETNEAYKECDFVNQKCVIVQGAGLDECQFDSQCITPPENETKNDTNGNCQGKMCKVIEMFSYCSPDCYQCAQNYQCDGSFCDAAIVYLACTDVCNSCIFDYNCGNNFCDFGEFCANCPSDCGVCEDIYNCGDNICNIYEDCSNCPSDCGVCPITNYNGDEILGYELASTIYKIKKYDSIGNQIFRDNINEIFSVREMHINPLGKSLIIGSVKRDKPTSSYFKNLNYFIKSFDANENKDGTPIEYDSGVDNNDWGGGVVHDSQNNIIATGYIAKSPYYITTIKYSPNGGDIIWKVVETYKTEPKAGVDSQDNVIIAGSTRLEGSNEWFYYIVKYNSNGNKLWDKVYDLNSEAETGYAVDRVSQLIIDSQGNLIIGGSTYQDGGPVKRFLTKFDSDGNFLWETKGEYDFLKQGTSQWGGIAIDSNDNIIITGTIQDYGYYTYQYYKDPPWGVGLTKDFLGFVRNTPKPSGTEDVAYSFYESPQTGGVEYKIFGIDSIYTVKYDKNGNKLWSKQIQSKVDYSISLNPPYYGFAFTPRLQERKGLDVEVDSNDNILILVETVSHSNVPRRRYVREIIKYDPNGNQIGIIPGPLEIPEDEGLFDRSLPKDIELLP